MLTDEQLIEDYRNGNESAFEELFDRYHVRIFQFSLRMLASPAGAEEAVQEIFMKVHRSISSYKPKERFPAWLFTIANRVCLDAIRKRNRQRWLLFGVNSEEPVSPLNPEKEVSRKEMKSRVLKEVEKLDEDRRNVFLLRIHGGLMFREIAAMLKMPLNTVLGRYHQAVRILKACLKEEHI